MLIGVATSKGKFYRVEERGVTIFNFKTKRATYNRNQFKHFFQVLAPISCFFFRQHYNTDCAQFNFKGVNLVMPKTQVKVFHTI